MHRAARTRNPDLVLLILNFENIDVTIKDKNGKTPAQIATHSEVRKLILEAVDR